jgi:hypothetical protein
MNKFSVLAFTALLMVAGAGPAGAAIMLANGQVMGAVTFANETLPSAGRDTVDGVTYYKVMNATDDGTTNDVDESELLAVIYRPGITMGVSNDTVGLTVDLMGIRFPASGAFSATVADIVNTRYCNKTTSTLCTTWADLSSPAASQVMEPTQRVFTFTGGAPSGSIGDDVDDATVGRTELELKVTLMSVLIPADSSGSIMITTSRDITGVGRVAVARNFPAAIMTAPALRESAETQMTPGLSATANVLHDFMQFHPVLTRTGSSEKVAKLGYIMSSVSGKAAAAEATPDELKMQLYDAMDGMKVSMLSDITNGAEGVITVMGDFSFVERATLRSGCTTTGDDRMDTDARDSVTTYSTEKVEAMVGDGTKKYLCLYVDGETEIPEGGYEATIAYAKKTDDVYAMAPMSKGPYSLGAIGRDGTTVHIPYLTTVEGKNHRIVMSNRSTAAANYSFSFRSETGTMANRGMAAQGTLAGGATVVMNVRDVVVIEGNSRRTAASVTFVADPKYIDVSTTLTNRATGAQSTQTHSQNRSSM